MILEYVSLFILIVGVTVAIYLFLFIHDIPYQIAKKRNHPHADMIHVGCWLSLVTLNAIWPLVYMWSVSTPQLHGAKMVGDNAIEAGSAADIADLRGSVEALKKQIEMLELRLEGNQS